MVNPIESCAEQFTSSQLISRPLVDLIVKQLNQLFECDAVQQRIKSILTQTRRANLQALARRLYSSFSAPLQQCLDLVQEKGASNWLTALHDYEFALHKFNQVFGMRLPSGMTGHLKIFLLPVLVAISSQLSMLYHALRVDFQPYVTMK